MTPAERILTHFPEISYQLELFNGDFLIETGVGLMVKKPPNETTDETMYRI